MGGYRAPTEINAAAKSFLGWIPPDEIEPVATSGTYRLYDLRKPVSPGQMHALTFVMGPYGYTHWLDFRPSDLGQDYYDNAITLHWVHPGDPVDIALVDTEFDTPSVEDASLRVGSTYSDPVNGVYVTPVGSGGPDPDYMDVVINIGPFPDNNAPFVSLTVDRYGALPGDMVQFTATAEDSDGDTLAYEWSIVDSLYNNSPTLAHTWPGPAGIYPVTVVVSDMKGGSATATLNYEVLSEPIPTVSIADILAFFDTSVANGSLVGNGPGRSAERRLNALRNQIEAAGDLIEDGLIEEACQQLMVAYTRADGEVPPGSPPDFIEGPHASELAVMIQNLRISLDCE
jgi:hypothetical protein